MEGLASSPGFAIVGAGAILAIPGAFIPLALKAISQTNPSDLGYLLEWSAFTLIALLPLASALIALLVAPRWTTPKLHGAREWLGLHLGEVAAILLFVLAASLLRNGIAGLFAGGHSSLLHR